MCGIAGFLDPAFRDAPLATLDRELRTAGSTLSMTLFGL